MDIFCFSCCPFGRVTNSTDSLELRFIYRHCIDIILTVNAMGWQPSAWNSLVMCEAWFSRGLVKFREEYSRKRFSKWFNFVFNFPLFSSWITFRNRFRNKSNKKVKVEQLRDAWQGVTWGQNLLPNDSDVLSLEYTIGQRSAKISRDHPILLNFKICWQYDFNDS